MVKRQQGEDCGPKIIVVLTLATQPLKRSRQPVTNAYTLLIFVSPVYYGVRYVMFPGVQCKQNVLFTL